jgi:hypothetical protein
MQEPTEIIAPRSAPFAGAFVAVAGAFFLAAGAYEVLAKTPEASTLTHILFPLVLGLLLVATAGLLAMRKGGMSIDRGARVVTVRGRSHADALVLPFDDIRAVKLRSTGGEGPWSIELLLADGAVLLVGEADEEQAASDFANRLVQQLPCLLEGDADAGPAHSPTAKLQGAADRKATPEGVRYSFRVGSRAALSVVLPLFGAACLMLGGILMASVQESPLLGFLAGPPLALLGLALLLAAGAKVLAREEVVLGAAGVSHGFRCLGLRYGDRELPLPADASVPYARIRPRGAHGVLLELVSGERSVTLASGVTTRSTGLDHRGIRALSAHLTADLAAAAQPPAAR